MAVPNPLTLSQNQKALLLQLARDSVVSYCQEGDANQVLENFEREHGSTAPFCDPIPCFVTLNRKDGSLRGCIGITESKQSLSENINIYAQMAAARDPRFPPVLLEECEQLVISISLLGAPEPLSDLSQIEIGRHGLIAELDFQRGLLLAKVAVEYSWTKEQFQEHTLIKAGISPENLDHTQFFYFEEFSFSEADPGD